MTKQLLPLEKLEEIKCILQEELIFHEDVDELIGPIEKSLKALEIITKSFDFDVKLGSLPDGTPTYKLNVWCKGTPTVVKPISKEQFDLLKEIVK